MSNLSPIDILRTYWLGSHILGSNLLKEKFEQNLTWDSIVKNGHISEIAPLLSFILKKIDAEYEMVSEDTMKRLKTIYSQFMVHNMLLHDELANVLG
ncbi:MAG: hypothetical protein QMC83_10555, partial [Thermodesulfovibrionales bacterium]|nr:hypothetical protein [Thermodesulfovibrionales bacterium]